MHIPAFFPRPSKAVRSIKSSRLNWQSFKLYYILKVTKGHLGKPCLSKSVCGTTYASLNLLAGHQALLCRLSLQSTLTDGFCFSNRFLDVL
ncbi:MAG TPA: hypothetical protein DDX91_07660 [Ruminococcaceae bacterium]|nr:hypothetical protein [Oscillospiraceae bacterium]